MVANSLALWVLKVMLMGGIWNDNGGMQGDVNVPVTYTVLHMFMQVLFWAGDQGDQETLTDFYGGEAKKKIAFFLPKWPTQKN